MGLRSVAAEVDAHLGSSVHPGKQLQLRDPIPKEVKIAARTEVTGEGYSDEYARVNQD